MSGHSKWATTKHKKAAIDAKRGKLFAKLIKNIEVAAKQGGGDLAGNPTLFDADPEGEEELGPQRQHRPRASSAAPVPRPAAPTTQTIMYEVYGPQGVAILVECLTDNKNRAAMEVRTAVTRNGGTLADPGSVSRLFTRKGVVVVPKSQEAREVTEDDVLEATLDAGAEEVNDLDESFQVQSEATDVVAVRTALQDGRHRLRLRRRRVRAEHGDPGRRSDGAVKVLRLVDALEDLDDVQNVFTNVDIPDDVLAAARGRRGLSASAPRARVVRRPAGGRRLAWCSEQMFGRTAGDRCEACACSASTPA